MFMARPPLDNELPRGSLPGQTQQLPSFSHFLSGVQQSDNSAQEPRPKSFAQQEAPNSFRRELFDPRNDFSRPRIEPEISPAQPLQHLEQHQTGRRTLLPLDTYSPAPAEHQIIQRLPGPHTYRPHHETQSSAESLSVASPQSDSGQAKTVIRETNIEGKGVCYVYDDGSICPKAVNGDAVNPKWGTTKAGKPRKRLGQACNTCREKKIRCDPQLPKCAQCQKFGRECKFETGNRGSNKGSSSSARASPTTPELSKDTVHDRHGSSVSAETLSEQLYSRQNSRSSINVESLLSPSSTVVSEDAPPAKKRKVSASPMNEFVPAQSLQRPPLPGRMSSLDVIPQRPLAFSIDTNPLEVDRRLTLRYIHQYVENVNSKLYHIFPASSFLRWIENGCGKNKSDLVVLYAIMAFSTRWSGSDDSDRDPHCGLFKRIAEDILKHHQTRLDFHCVLGRLILSFQALSDGDVPKSRFLTASTLRISCDMGLHTENGLEDLLSQGIPCFGFDTETSKECMRRVFWLAYSGNCFQKYCAEQRHDDETLKCSLRLPCNDSSYDANSIPDLPIFHSSMTAEPDILATSKNGIIAFLVEISSILDQVICFQLSAKSNHKQGYEPVYNKIKTKLLSWDKRMRKHISDLQRTETSAGNDDTSRPNSAEEHSGTGTSGLHLLYYFVAMVLHRHVAWHDLSSVQVDRCVKESYNQAVRTLDLVHRLDEDGGATMPFARMAKTCPIASLAVLAAADVITAAGAMSEVYEHQHDGNEQNFLELVSCAIRALEESSPFWRTAERQSKLVQERLKPILALSRTVTKKAFFFRKPLYSPFGLDHDVVYGPPRIVYFRALGKGDQIRKDSDIMEMGVPSPG